MVIDRLGAQTEALRDLLARGTIGQEREYLPLPSRQRHGRSSTPLDLPHHAPGDLRGEERLPLSDRADRRRQLLSGRLLQEVAVEPERHHAADVLIARVHREEQHCGCGLALLDLARHL